MGSERFASPIMGIFCGGLNAYCMRIWPLFLRTSGSSGVLKALLLERNRQLSCNPKKKKKKKISVVLADTFAMWLFVTVALHAGGLNLADLFYFFFFFFFWEGKIFITQV